MSNSLEWAQRSAKEFKERVSAREREKAVFLEEQRIRTEYTTKLWAEILTSLNESVISFNQVMGREVLKVEHEPKRGVVLFRHEPTPQAINVSCDHGASEVRVTARSGGHLLSFAVQVDRETGKAHLVYKANEPTPEQAAEKIIETLLEL